METNAIVSAYRKKIGATQVSVEHKLEALGETSISKVLGVSASGFASNVEVLNGEANYAGEVVFTAIYLDEQNNVLSITDKVPFSGKMENNTLNSGMQPIYKVEVVDTSILGASNLEINVQSTVELTFDAVDSYEIYPFSPVDENVITKKEMTKCSRVIDSGSAIFTVQDEITFKNNIKRVLYNNSSLCVKNVTAGTGYFTVEGDIYFKGCAVLNDGEKDYLEEIDTVIAFKEEVDAEKVQKEQELHVSAFIKCSETTCEFNSEGESTNKLMFTVPVCVKYIAMETMEIEMPMDAYSLTHKVNLVSDTYYLAENQTAKFKEHIDGNLEISEDAPRINKVLTLSSQNLNIANYLLEDNLVKVEGVMTVNVIYRGDDEMESTNSVQVEVPFSANLDVKDYDFKGDVFVEGAISNISVRVKREKDIEVDADLEFTVDCYDKKPETFIKEVVLTEEIPASSYALEIYLAPQGSTLWSIAKHLNVKEEVILMQNKDLVYPLEKMESVVYFK